MEWYFTVLRKYAVFAGRRLEEAERLDRWARALFPLAFAAIMIAAFAA